MDMKVVLIAAAFAGTLWVGGEVVKGVKVVGKETVHITKVVAHKAHDILCLGLCR